MRRISTEVIVVGSGGAAMMAVARLLQQGIRVAYVNPVNLRLLRGSEDLLPCGGLSLWNAAYRHDVGQSLPDLYDVLRARLKEVFPAEVDQSGLRKMEVWSLLSSTHVHRLSTNLVEQEFFRLEKRDWAMGQYRLVNPEYIRAKMTRLGLVCDIVAKVEGALVRQYGLWWNGLSIAQLLWQHLWHKHQNGGLGFFVGRPILGQYGRRLVLEGPKGEEFVLEAERGVCIMLTGQLLPEIKTLVHSKSDAWIQGVRKRRREQHLLHLESAALSSTNQAAMDPFWLELGPARYCWGSKKSAVVLWKVEKGPDDFDRIADESLRMTSGSFAGKLCRAERHFVLDWDWKGPQWKVTDGSVHWATGFEGDLWKIMEVVWNMPQF